MGEKEADDLAGAVDLKDEQDITTDGSSLEPENEEDDLVSITDKAIILGLEGIIEELKHNDSNNDAFRREFIHFRNEYRENFQEIKELKQAEKYLLMPIANNVSIIRSILFWVLIGLPVIFSIASIAWFMMS